MKAIQMTSVKNLKLVELDAPVPEKDEVLLKVMAVGVCGSDIPRINKYGSHVLPIIPGHEFAGEIVEIGKEVTGWSKGDRACVAPLIPCYKCRWCKTGNYSLCENYSYNGSRCDGAMAEYVAVKAKNLVKLKDNVPYDWGATVDPAANAIHTFLRGKVTKEDSVCVFGMGAIGLFAIQYAKAIGVKKVVAVDINDKKLSAAKACGADFTINSSVQNVSEEINKLTDGQGISAVLEMSGSPIAQHQAILIAEKLGRIVFLGISHAELTLSKEAVEAILRRQLSIIGSWNSFSKPFPGREWTDAVKLMSEGKLSAKEIITHKLELKDVPATFKKIDEEGFYFNKIMFYPH